MNKALHIGLLIILSSLVFHFVNLNGSLTMDGLPNVLWSPPDAIYQWNVGDTAPFKYRILFRGLVLTLWKLTNQTNDSFFLVYKATSNVFYSATMVLYYVFLLTIGFTRKQSFFGGLLLILCPPFLMAYYSPVHTREDMMGYTILLIGLILIEKKIKWPLLPVFLLGVACRETLLLLPLLYLLVERKEALTFRIILFTCSLTLFILIRILKGYESYDVFEGLRWNIDNPVQVLGFLFLTFGVFWVPFLHTLIRGLKNPIFLRRSSFLAFAIILVTTFIGGIFNEIRLLFLMFPWVITISYRYILDHRGEIHSVIRKKSFLVYVTLLLISIITLGIYLLSNTESLLHPSPNLNISYSHWISITLFSLFIFLSLLPVYFNLERNHFKTMKV